MLTNMALDHPEWKISFITFPSGFAELGWVDGQNIRVETRGAAGIADNYRKYAAELIALNPDVVLPSPPPR